MLHEYRTATLGGEVVLGGLLSIAGLLSASTASIVQSNAVGRAQPVVSLVAWAMLFGTLFDAALAWLTAGPPQFDWSAAYLGSTLYLALFGSVVTFPLYFGLIRVIGAGRAAYSGVATPVVAMALSTLFEGYRWTMLPAVGAAIALAGLVIALSGRRTAIPQEPA
jgi:drug/metabolite transporter (DMT)-like permease